MRFRGKYNFLSNMYPCTILYQGKQYASVEHAYQAAKFDEEELKEEIRTESTPGKAKRLANKHKDKIKDNWHDIKVAVMYTLLLEKFKNPVLRKKLKEVDERIVEDNTWNDTFWGVCNGKGKNNLGKLLERVKLEVMCFN